MKALLKRLESLIRKKVIKGMITIEARNDPTFLKNSPKNKYQQTAQFTSGLTFNATKYWIDVSADTLAQIWNLRIFHSIIDHETPCQQVIHQKCG